MQEEPHQSQFISDSWTSRWEGVLSAQREGLNWLFALNIGGVAGVLTYASAKQTTYAVVVALVAFSLGLLCMIVFAVCYYYMEERMFFGFKRDVAAFRAGTISWNTLIERENSRPDKYRVCEVTAWFAIAFAVAGIVSSAIAIL